MRASALGALVGWAAVVAAYVAWPGSFLVAVALAIAIGFTALLLGHLLALTARVARIQGVRSEAVEVSIVGRRMAVARGARVALGALLTSVVGFGLFGRQIEAQASCEGAHDTNALFSSEFCAKDEAEAIQDAQKFFSQKAKRFAKDFCSELSSYACPKCTPNERRIGTLTTPLCKDIGACPGSKGKHRRFECASTLQKVECRC